MVRNDVTVIDGEPIVYSTTSTVAELIEGCEYAKNNGKIENSQLEGTVEYLFGLYNKNIDTTNIDEVIKQLEDIQRIYPTETIETIAEKEKSGDEFELTNERIDPESELNLGRIEMLVEEYEMANEKRQNEISAEIKEILNRYKGKEKSEVDRLIERLYELKSQGVLDSNLEAEIEAQLEVEIPEEIVENEPIAERLDRKEIRRDRLREQTQHKEVKETGVEAKRKKLKREIYDRDHPEEVQAQEIEALQKSFDDAVRLAPDDQKPLVKQYGENMVQMASAKRPYIKPELREVSMMMEANGVGPGIVERAGRDVETLLQFMYNNPKEIRNIYNDIKSLGLAGLQQKYLPNIPEVRSFQSLITAIDADRDVILGLQSMVNGKIKMIEGVTNFVSTKVPGGAKLVASVSEKIGGMAVKDLVLGSMEILTKEGLITGGKAVLEGVLVGMKVTTGATGLSASATTIAGLVGALPPLAIAVIVALAAVALVYVAYKIYDSVAGLVKRITGTNFLWGVRDFVVGLFGDNWFGKTVGTIAQFGFNGMVGFGIAIGALFGPILAAGMATMTTLIAPVIIGLVIFFGGMGAIVGGMVSTQVPPPPMAAGGTCQPKDSVGSPPITDGTNNCNIAAPENNTGIDKANFVNHLAADWQTGKNYSDECFNDVVNRALCAGINPQYALWVWLHESGASNYSNAVVEDFGIHGNPAVPVKNFDKQINWFLKLDPGKACPSLGYWLSLATNFLTGGCDPNKGIPQSDGTMMTGYRYLEEEIKPQWGWIKAGVLPADIHVPKGGSQCGSTGSTVATADNEFVNSDGVLMVCSGPVDENGNFIGQPGSGAFNPDSPGLIGEEVSGECSVSKSVVLTKQCGQAWSNKSLPGGSGTICSAGCGPSSVSSIVRTTNGSYTPDTIIFESGSPYSSMNGDGSSLGQAQSSLAKHGFTAGNLGGCTQKDIANWICEGKAVIILANSYTGNGGNYIGHILPVVAVSGGKLITKDPYYSNTTPFITSGGRVAGQIKDLLQCLTVDLKKD